MSSTAEIDIYSKLREYIKRSGKTQRKVAEEAGIPNPSYLSHMVNGRINWVDSEYFRPICEALNLSVAEIAELKPDVIWSQPTAPEPESAAFDPRALFHPPAQRLREKRPLWPNLAAMIEEKQERYPQLRETRWQQHLNQTRFANGKDPDPDGWFEMYQAMRRNNVEPEAWPDED